MTLGIQTNIPGELHAWLVTGSRIRHHLRRVQYHGSEKVLRLVHQLLIGSRRPVSQIVVVRGPGRFTAVRTGLVVANTLGWLWNIPVSGIVTSERLTPNQLQTLAIRKKSVIIRPWYGGEPNITKPKRRR